MSESNLPVDVLEQRAADQRRRLHNSVDELKTSVSETVRETFDLKRYAREYMAPAAAMAAIVGLLLGYNTAGMFTRR